jgi:hypothetical protein
MMFPKTSNLTLFTLQSHMLFGLQHAIWVFRAMLRVAFVIAFPLGDISRKALRSSKIHWSVQLFNSVAFLIGLCVVIALSVLSVQWADFGFARQIIGALWLLF